MGEIAIVAAEIDRLDDLTGFWELLHRHQGSVCAAVDGLELRSEAESTVIVREMYREWLTGPESFAFLALEDGRPVGYVIGFFDEPHFMWETGRVGHVDSFYVLPEMRGRGVGRLLMDAAYAVMQEAGAETVALEMVAENEVARKFYEREGFTTTFVQMHRRLPPQKVDVFSCASVLLAWGRRSVGGALLAPSPTRREDRRHPSDRDRVAQLQRHTLLPRRSLNPRMGAPPELLLSHTDHRSHRQARGNPRSSSRARGRPARSESGDRGQRPVSRLLSPHRRSVAVSPAHAEGCPVLIRPISSPGVPLTG
jgi:GNAT superfamily N-acetyltransferase